MSSSAGEPEGPLASWQAGPSAVYSTGAYGTTTRTTSLYVPFTMRRLFDQGDVSLVIPYAVITSNCGVTLLSGIPLQTGGVCSSGTSGTLPQRVTNSGLGDILVRARYYLYTEQGLLPSLVVGARIKAPTADRDKGLGTGAWDENINVGLVKVLTSTLVMFVDGGYTFIGNPPGTTLQNQWSYDVGLGYYIQPTLLASAYYEEARALVAGLQPPQDALASLAWTLTPAWRLSAMVEKGLSRGAPDYAASVGASVRF